MPELHRLLRKQLARAQGPGGELDVQRLLALVSATYEDDERDRRRIDRANQLMAEEIETAQRELQASMESLRQQNTRFDAALQNMGQGLCMFDRERHLVVANRRFIDMFELQGENLVGLPLADVARRCASRCDDAGTVARESEALVALALKPTRGMLQQERADGRILVVAHEPMGDGGFVHTFDDVTAWRAADAKMARMASHDTLTDLPNRMLLREHLEYALAHRHDGRGCALLYVDLDRFKAVNDTLGHPAGDQLLIQVTQRLRQIVRGTDTVARLGGDEFAVLLDGLSAGFDVAEIAERIVQALEQPFDLDGQTANIGASIGIALAPEHGVDADVLTKRADLALYQAKGAGRGRWCFFEPEMDTAAQGRREIEVELRRALAGDEFEVYYQPVVELQDQRVSGCEALLRWHSPSRGMVPPDRFIPLAEELGLIVGIGDWVLRRACQDAARWPGELSVAVNVSARQFQQGEALVASVTSALQDAGLAPQRLELEITETLLMGDNAATLQTLLRLREMGVRIVMDDFGIGYSSLAYLRSFPFDKVKIDKSFVQEIGERADALAIVRAVSGLCNSLGVASTAEGVETNEQLDSVTDHECTQAQGYLFSKPVPNRELPELLARLSRQLSLPIGPDAAPMADGSRALEGVLQR